MREYIPHENDAGACRAALDLIYVQRLSASAEEIASLHHVIQAWRKGDAVTQHEICRAHDVIFRMRGNR